MMFRRFLASLLIIWATCGLTPSYAAPTNNSYNVGVCDPSYGQRCLKPAADGSIAISGGFSSLTPFAPTGNTTLAVTGSTGRVGLPSADTSLLLQNLGTSTAYFKLGTVSVTATVADTPLLPGQAIVLSAAGSTYIAAITGGSTTTLGITTGTGTPTLGNAVDWSQPNVLAAFTPTSSSANANLSATTSSQATALPAGVSQVVQNTGSATAYVSFSVGAGTATTSSYPVQAGTQIVFSVGTSTYINYITASGSTSLTVSGGSGVPVLAGGVGGSSGGGAVTIANGADVALGNTADPVVANGVAGTAASYLRTIKDSATSTTPSAVNLTQVGGATAAQGHGTAAAALRVELPTDGTGVVGLNAGTNTIGAVGLVASTTGGTTPYGLQSAASTNSTTVKASAGVLYGMNLINTTTTIYYLRTYDAASAPTCSSATNFVRSWPIPPAAAAGGAGGVAVSLPVTGTQYSTGISFCLTGGGSSTDNTNAATGVYVNLDYK